MNFDGEGDNEDLWLKCLENARILYGWSESRVLPQRTKKDDVIALADKLYDRCKSKTERHQKARPKLVTQLKS